MARVKECGVLRITLPPAPAAHLPRRTASVCSRGRGSGTVGWHFQVGRVVLWWCSVQWHMTVAGLRRPGGRTGRPALSAWPRTFPVHCRVGVSRADQ